MVVSATIADLPARLAAGGNSGPVIVMIGRVFEHAATAAADTTSATPASKAAG
jgi:siroheme synthase